MPGLGPKPGGLDKPTGRRKAPPDDRLRDTRISRKFLGTSAWQQDAVMPAITAATSTLRCVDFPCRIARRRACNEPVETDQQKIGNTHQLVEWNVRLSLLGR